MTTPRPAAQDRFPTFTVGPSIEVDPLTATIGAELRSVNLAEAARGRRRSSPSSRRCCCSTRCCSSATRTSPAPSTSPSPSGSARSRTTRSRGSDPDHPGLVRIYKDLDSLPEHYENAYHCDATWREIPPMGAVLRCVETPPVGGDTIWVNMVEAYAAAARARQGPDRRPVGRGTASRRRFGAAMPTEQRRALKDRFPDAEHPVVRTHPETGEKVLFVNAFTTHFVNFHTPENVRFGLDYAPGRERACSTT